jgi:glyoxylase-like metal-dependent hydrolase (beta-lactamase superfamily II)
MRAHCHGQRLLLDFVLQDKRTVFMRVTETLHLVASGDMGMSLTDAYDCNAWLIESEDGLILFDTGAGRDVTAIILEMSRAGLDPSDLKHIFLTHAHADHSGGVVPLLQGFASGVILHAGRETAARMASGDESRISLDTARRFGVYPETYRWHGAEVDTVLADNDTVMIGGTRIQLLETPGHSQDHCSYLVTRGETVGLITGDALFAGGRVILQDIPDCSISATLETVRRLDRLCFDAFLPGHGLFSLRDGMRHVSAAMKRAQAGLAPTMLA